MKAWLSGEGSRDDPDVPEWATMVPEARRHAADDLPDVRRFRRGLVTPGTVEETALVRLLDTPELQRMIWKLGPVGRVASCVIRILN